MWKSGYWKPLTLTALLVSCAMLGGCWDYVELENRAIIVGLGIDELPPQRYKGKEMRMYQLIIQVVEPTEQGGGSGSGGSGGSGGGGMGGGAMGGGAQGPQKGYTNFTVVASSLADGIERIVNKSDRLPNMAHLQFIGLGEKVSKKGINEIYDFFSRFPQMRRHTEIAVLTGDIAPYFVTPSATEPTPALHIAEMVDTIQRTVNMPEVNFGTVSKSTRKNIPFLLLKLSLDPNNQIVVNEAAVFKHFRMAGVVNKGQAGDLSILQDEIQRGILQFSCYGGKKAGLQILDGKAKIKPSMVQGKPNIRFEVELETELMEYQCLGASFKEAKTIAKLEKRYGAEIKKRLERTGQELIKKYRADLFRLGIRLKKNPEMYKMIRDNPEQFFGDLTMEVKVDLKIRNIGNSVQTPKSETLQQK